MPSYRIIVVTAEKIKVFIKDFFSKFDQIRGKLRIWSHLLNKSSMGDFIFSAVCVSKIIFAYVRLFYIFLQIYA